MIQPLGGNSGSPVINLKTGEVVGMHCGGRYKKQNCAITVDVIFAHVKDFKMYVNAGHFSWDAITKSYVIL